MTLIGRLFDEGTVAQAGLALEKAFGVAEERLAGFQDVARVIRATSRSKCEFLFLVADERE